MTVLDTVSAVGILEDSSTGKNDAESFYSIADSLKDSIIIVDDAAKIIYWNKSAEKTFGFTSAETIGKDIHKLVLPASMGPEEKEQIKIGVQIFSETGMGYFTIGNVKLVGCRKDRSVFPIELSLSPIKISEKWRAVGVVKDITQRTLDETNLRVAEQRYHALFNQAPVGVLIVDPKNNCFVEFNDVAHSQLGYSREEFEKLSLAEIVSGKSKNEIKKELFELMNARVGSFEAEHQAKSGEIRNVLVNARAVKLKGNEYLHCIFHDITEMRLIQKRLRESESQYRQLVELAQEGVWVLTRDYVTVFVNPKMAEMLEYAPSEMIGQSLFDFLEASTIPLAKDFLGKFTYGASGHFEYEFIKKNGSHVYASIAASQMTDDNGDYLGTLALVSDITLRKEMEIKLEKYSKSLEEVISLKKQELEKAHAQLIKSERLAAIGELSGMIGHDLRNPLAGIKNAAYYLKRKSDSLSPQQKEMLGIIDRCVESSNKIINDLLDYSRELSLDLKNTSMEKLMLEILTMVNIPKNVTLVRDFATDVTFQVDANKISRVFANLMKNAVEAMPAGGLLSLRSKLENGGLVISFTDTGPGIPEDILPKLFLPLFTTKAQGMGFGLAICKRIIEAHGGKITVMTAIGKGTIFVITLPLESNKKSGSA